jgi:hypothetical protein
MCNVEILKRRAGQRQLASRYTGNEADKMVVMGFGM